MSVPHCFRWDWQSTARAWFRARDSVGMRIAISSAMIEITTNNSISVKPLIALSLRAPPSLSLSS